MKETILFFLIVVINGLICINYDIGLDTCTRGLREEVFFPLLLCLYQQNQMEEKVEGKFGSNNITI